MPGQQLEQQYQLFTGTGRAIGVDLLVNYQTKNYNSWVAYTLSKTTNQIAEIYNNDPYPNQNDRRHQFKWINHFTYKKFKFSLNGIYSSGKPYLAIRNLDDNDRGRFDPDLVFRNLPFYGRIDVGVNYNFKLFQQTASLGISCFNLTDRRTSSSINKPIPSIIVEIIWKIYRLWLVANLNY